MTGYGWGVYQYHQFYDKELDMYQVLPCPYMGSFEGFSGHKFVKEKRALDLADQAEKIVWERIEKG